MSAEVEARRFRTWDARSQTHSVRSWWLIVRSLAQRYYKVWYVYMVMALGLFGAILGVFLLSLFSSDLPRGVDPGLISEGPMAFIGIAMALFAMLVTAPSIAEDIRFNAQLFYFSKPMHIRDYMLGKNAFNFMGLALVGLVPMLVLSLTALSIGPGDEQALRAALADSGQSAADTERYIAEWRFGGVDTWGEAFYVAGMPLLAVITISIGLVGVTMAMSSFTRRAWHAAVGTVIFVTSWSVLGAVVSDAKQSADRLLYHPAGWIEAVTFLPFQKQFPYGECVTPEPFCTWYLARLENAEATIWLSHLFLVSAGVLGLAVTWFRLKRLEGAA